MNLAKRIKSIISLITASTILFSFTGCEFGKATQESQTNPQTSTSAVINVDTEVNDINDAFVELNIQPNVVSPANILEINVEDIVVNPVNVKEVQNIEVEVIPINDEFVTVNKRYCLAAAFTVSCIKRASEKKSVKSQLTVIK